MLRPYGMKMIVADPDKTEEVTKTGIVLPGGPVRGKWSPVITKVLAVGPGIYFQNGTKILPDVQPGDTVLLCLQPGEKVMMDGQPVYIIDVREAMAIVKDV